MSESANTALRRLFEPLTIANFTIRNRVVNTPHGSGLPAERDLRYIEERAKGGVGLFGLGTVTGPMMYNVGLGAEGAPYQWDTRAPSPVSAKGIELYDSIDIPLLSSRAKVIHAHGAKVFGQVAHAGASNYHSSMNPLIGPSNVATPADAIVPHALTDEQVEEIVISFAHGIRRIAEAGLDAAELHGAHGYLISQFLSPYYNRRTDKWGGSVENRVRFPLAIIAAARKMIGDFPIGIRLGYEGLGHGPGLTIEGLVETARLIDPHVCHISVSGGNGPGITRNGYELAYLSPWYREPAYNAQAAAAVRAAVKAPVIVTGRIADPAIAESLLAEGSADMIGMVRGLIADPQLLVKARAGRSNHQRMCLGLNECHHAGQYRTPMTCAANAAAGREDELAIVPAEQRKTVVVVGAGPAGMETARVAALRGHKVYLCDREPVLGGTPRLLAADPNRRNLRDQAAYFEAELAELDVELVLGHEVSADDVANFGADAVVIATGGRPIVPDVPGIDGPTVHLALDVLRGAVPPRRVVVVAGTNNHLHAPTLAEHLFDKGHEVQLVCEQLDFGTAIEDVTRYEVHKRLRQKGIVPQMATALAAVDSGVVLRDLLTGEERRVEDAGVVVACGLLPENTLHQALKGKIGELHVIGDAFAPRRIMHATVEGARTATAL